MDRPAFATVLEANESTVLALVEDNDRHKDFRTGTNLCDLLKMHAVMHAHLEIKSTKNKSTLQSF